MKLARYYTCFVTLSWIICASCELTYNHRANVRHKPYVERLRSFGQALPVVVRGPTPGQPGDGLLMKSLQASAVESLCPNHTAMIEEAARNLDQWATKVYDSIGRQPAGMAEHPTLIWLGDYDECVGIEPVAYTDPASRTGEYTPFQTQYCKVYFDASALAPKLVLNVGFCFPDSCNRTEVMALADAIAKSSFQVPFNLLPAAWAVCDERELELDGKAKAVIAVCAVFAALIVLATAYDVIIVLFLTKSNSADDSEDKKSEKPRSGAMANGGPHTDPITHNPLYDRQTDEKTPLLNDLTLSDSQANATSHHKHDVGKLRDDVRSPKKTLGEQYKPGLLGRLLLSFSAYTNAAKLLNTSQPSGVLTSVNGIRFITMTWVILGHTFVFGDNSTRNFGNYFVTLIKRFTYQVIANETVAVDTFFVLSGLLVAYLTLKELQKKKGPLRFNWFLFYFHRFWRLTPPYMLVLMLYVPLIKYWGDGPMWSQTGVEQDECEDTWWRNLLYINNLYDTDKMCMGWSWYLANDMQFYVISPLILVPFFYSGLAGSVLCFLLVLGNLITTGLISKHYNISATIKLDSPPSTGDSFDKIYVKPYTRVAPYAIGLLAGYILYKTKCIIRVPKGRTVFGLSYRRFYQLLNVFGWAIATALALLVIYGPYTSDGKYTMTEGESAFYNAAFRTGWGIAIAWVVLACATGYGGPVNALLSWPALIPPSRLTYVAYLIHPVVMDVYYMSQRELIYWYDLEIIYEFLGHLCMSYGVAFVVSLAFESPMMGLEKVLLGRNKRS